MVIQILHTVQYLWAEERQSLCKSLLSIHCNRPSAHLLSVEDIFLLSWQDAFNQETARAMSFPLLWYQSLYCARCLPRLMVCLTAPDQGCTGRIWSPKTSCTLTRPAGGCYISTSAPLQVLVYHLDITKACRVNLSTWLEENGWNSSFCFSTFDTQGDEVLEDIRNKVSSLFHCKSNTGCPNKSSR